MNIIGLSRNVVNSMSEKEIADNLINTCRDLLSANMIDLEPEFINVAFDENNWKESGDAFDKIRKKTLFFEKIKDEERSNYLIFQENILKVINNLSSNIRRFDSDSAYWAVYSLAYIVSKKGWKLPFFEFSAIDKVRDK